jgi:hypothetical protein
MLKNVFVCDMNIMLDVRWIRWTAILVPLVGSSMMLSSPESEEPPKHPYLADSCWPMSHRNTYNQGSALLPGPERNDRLTVDFTYLLPAVIGLVSTKGDSNGSRNLWFHTPFNTGKLLTKKGERTKVVDTSA